MASNHAARRAAKANRRKAIVAQKRKGELRSGTLAARVAAATGAPIRACLINEGWQSCGMASVFLVRGASADQVTMGMFLLDASCLGVKDVSFQSLDGGEFGDFMSVAEEAMALTEIEPSYARKLIRDVVAWARSLGFAPHRDFAAVERLFGDVRADDCVEEFRFGAEGAPVYIPGPFDTPAQMRQRLEQVAEIQGAGYVLPHDVEDDEDVLEGEIVTEEVAAIAK